MENRLKDSTADLRQDVHYQSMSVAERKKAEFKLQSKAADDSSEAFQKVIQVLKENCKELVQAFMLGAKVGQEYSDFDIFRKRGDDKRLEKMELDDEVTKFKAEVEELKKKKQRMQDEANG